MLGIPTFGIFLFYIFSISNIYSKLIYNEEIQGNVYKCRRLYSFTDKKINKIFDRSLILSQLKEVNDLCFIQCLYHKSGIIDDRGLIRVDFVIRSLRKHNYPSVNTNSEIEDEFFRIAKDVISMCHHSSLSSEKLCGASVAAVECLEAVIYLFNYGYLNSNHANDLSTFVFTQEVYRRAITEFQRFFSLSVTGELDANCLEIMNSPRCGVMDIGSSISRSKRYDLYRLKWNAQNLTYKITKYSKKLNKNLTDEEISRAFEAWASVSNLTIEKNEDPKADISIRFEKRIHGDRVPFDGPGQILAHTFYPVPVDRNRLRSFIHFDNAEKWTVGSKRGVNLYQIAVHEIGHSLGLKHSNVKDSVMWPKHDGYVANFTLHNDDIDAIQALYGSAN